MAPTAMAVSEAVAINLYTVQGDLEQEGWKLVSTEYKNLKTPLSMECPKGHSVEITFEDWRKHHSCPACKQQESERLGRNIIRPRDENVKKRILVLDAATGTTGWAIFDDRKLTAYGTFTTMRNWETPARIHQLICWLDKNLQIWQPDAIGIENIQLEGNVNTFQKLANLQGALMEYCISQEYTFELAYSSTWRSFIGFKKDQREEIKKKTQAWVHMMYGISPTEDEADAIAMGQYFVNEFSRSKASWGEDI